MFSKRNNWGRGPKEMSCRDHQWDGMGAADRPNDCPISDKISLAAELKLLSIIPCDSSVPKISSDNCNLRAFDFHHQVCCCLRPGDGFRVLLVNIKSSILDLHCQSPKMFKRTLARQAGLCSARRVASPALLRSSIRLQTKPVNRIASISRISAYTPLAVRSYSSATAEQVEQDVGAPSGPITRFADLESLGVHDTLLKAITQDMGYETMTDVQSMTIAPGLAGKDMCVESVQLHDILD